ncbi:MAG: hypothetical protein ACRDTV_10165, partial [Mycobacterium sp.]
MGRGGARAAKLPHCARHGSKLLFVSKDLLANGRGRWLAIAASLVVAAAIFHAQATEHRCCV